MKKTTDKKRLSIIVMTMAMTTSMTMSSLAVPNPTPSVGTPGNFANNSANSTVSIVGMSDIEIDANLSAMLPITVTLAIMGDSGVKGPDNYAVRNTSQSKRVRVTNIKATAKSGYNIIDNPAPADKVDLKTISMTPNLDTTLGDTITLWDLRGGNGHTTVGDYWTMEAANNPDPNKTSVGIGFGGHIDDVGKLSSNATNQGGEEAFLLTYTIQTAAP